MKTVKKTSENGLKVFVTRRLPLLTMQRLQALFDVTLHEGSEPASRVVLQQAVSTHDVLVTTLCDRIDASLLELAAQAGKLRMIANFGNGYDHIDLLAAKKYGVIVTNTPDVLTEDTADFTMGMIIALTRGLVVGCQLMQSGDWQGWSPTQVMGRRLRGKNLGIIGMGRIGRAVARRAAIFGLHIHYHSRTRLEKHIENQMGLCWWDSLDQMLSRMDIISTHCLHTPATYHLLSRRRLALLPKHACVVNTSRGEVIDEQALLEALREERLAGAALDVYYDHQNILEQARKMSNVILCPHIGSATAESRIETGNRVIANIVTFSNGRQPLDQLDGVSMVAQKV